MTIHHSPLDAAHRALNAKMVPFGGWEMPMNYPAGTLAEHRACRETAVVFDVSHLGSVRVQGDDAFERLQNALTNDLHKIGPGRAQYTHLLDPDDASILDDIIVWWIDETTFDVMPNASNTDRVTDALGGNAVDITASRAILALQGPKARELFGHIAADAAEVGRFAVRRFTWNDIPCVVAGTGYTGEDGIEVSIPAEHAPQLWDAVLAEGFLPAGLGARDTLRLEAGLPLYGHELGPGITPLQAGLGWVVSWTKGPFQGREALAKVRDDGPGERLRGLVVPGRRPPRADQSVVLDGQVIGKITSGNFSPTLESGIAMAYVRNDIDVGVDVEIDMRGTSVPARTVPFPFVGRPA